jgi:hypothetical protein
MNSPSAGGRPPRRPREPQSRRPREPQSRRSQSRRSQFRGREPQPGDPAPRQQHSDRPGQRQHHRGLPTPAGQPPPNGASGPRVRIGSPSDVLALVPHLLGFHPSSSLVVIGAGGPGERVRFGARYDLPDPPSRDAAAGIAAHVTAVLSREGLTTVIVVGYGPGRLVTPVTDVLAPAIAESGLWLREMLRAEDGRYWSYLCSEPGCCPPEGVPFDLSSHPVAAAMTVAGLPAYPDRAALERTLAPVTGRAAVLARAATRRACDRAAALLAPATQPAPAPPGRAPLAGPWSGCQGPGDGGGPNDPAGRGDPSGPGDSGGQDDGLRRVAAEGKRAVREAIAAYRAGGTVTEDHLAWLAVTLTDLRVRDDAWARMEPGYREAHLRLWTDLVRRAEPALVPAPAALLAFVAWQSGNGTLAGIALDRALAADPGYSLALLLRDILTAGIPPSAARLPMTPEEVEESYARAGREARRARRRGGAGQR